MEFIKSSGNVDECLRGMCFSPVLGISNAVHELTCLPRLPYEVRRTRDHIIGLLTIARYDCSSADINPIGGISR